MNNTIGAGENIETNECENCKRDNCEGKGSCKCVERICVKTEEDWWDGAYEWIKGNWKKIKDVVSNAWNWFIGKL